MTIRKKIVISNIIMIFIPIIVIVIITTMILEGSGNKYLETMENMYQDKNSLVSAQSMIFSYKDDFSEQELKTELSNLGYHFSISTNGELIYNNITEKETSTMNNLVEAAFNNSDSFTLSSDENSIIKSSFYVNKNEYIIVAIHTTDSVVSKGNQSYLKKYILSYLFLLVISVLVVIFVLNALLSWWLSKSILKPLKKISIGSRKIKDGDLDFKVDYNKTDEFGEVCKDFDEMRGHLKDSVEERLKYEKYRTELLSGISHDIRTPLTSIKGYTEGLIDGIADTPEKQKRYYDAIHRRANDMEDLLDSLSTYTYFENNQIQYDLKYSELNTYINNVVQEYQIDAIKNKVEILCEFSEKPLPVYIDYQMMQRVILNIFSNSIKYRIKETSKIIIITEQNENHAIMKITDDGPGVMIEDLKHIFECFYRGDASRTKPGDGSGLGLSIVKQIVEGHDGWIQAKNEEGLSISIGIPIREENKNEENFNC